MTPYYADDAVTIYHADSREWLPDADVIVSDPPYGISWDSQGGGSRSRARERNGVVLPRVIGDDEPFDPTHLLALGLPTVLFGANHYGTLLPPSPSWLVWDKRAGGGRTHQADCELAWSNLGGPARLFSLEWRGGGSRMRDNRDGGGNPFGFNAMVPKTGHPTQKPLALMRWVIEMCPDGTVLDPYMGSGTTLMAAKSLGRKAIGVEIDEAWCEAAARRCSQEVLGLAV